MPLPKNFTSDLKCVLWLWSVTWSVVAFFVRFYCPSASAWPVFSFSCFPYPPLLHLWRTNKQVKRRQWKKVIFILIDLQPLSLFFSLSPPSLPYALPSSANNFLLHTTTTTIIVVIVSHSHSHLDMDFLCPLHWKINPIIFAILTLSGNTVLFPNYFYLLSLSPFLPPNHPSYFDYTRCSL